MWLSCSYCWSTQIAKGETLAHAWRLSKRERLFPDQASVHRDLDRLQYLSHALVAVCILVDVYSAIEF